jgi:hypothetical protein
MVPDEHDLGTEIALRDQAFEAKVVHRMILDTHGETLVGGSSSWSALCAPSSMP